MTVSTDSVLVVLLEPHASLAKPPEGARRGLSQNITAS